MTESQYFCPRLIDYLAIVGAHPNSLKRSSLYELQNNGIGSDERCGINSAMPNNEDNFYIQVMFIDRIVIVKLLKTPITSDV